MLAARCSTSFVRRAAVRAPCPEDESSATSPVRWMFDDSSRGLTFEGSVWSLELPSSCPLLGGAASPSAVPSDLDSSRREHAPSNADFDSSRRRARPASNSDLTKYQVASSFGVMRLDRARANQAACRTGPHRDYAPCGRSHARTQRYSRGCRECLDIRVRRSLAAGSIHLPRRGWCRFGR